MQQSGARLFWQKCAAQQYRGARWDGKDGFWLTTILRDTVLRSRAAICANKSGGHSIHVEFVAGVRGDLLKP